MYEVKLEDLDVIERGRTSDGKNFITVSYPITKYTLSSSAECEHLTQGELLETILMGVQDYMRDADMRSRLNKSVNLLEKYLDKIEESDKVYYRSIIDYLKGTTVGNP